MSCKSAARRNYYVLVEWPGGPPWLVMIEASSTADARKSVLDSDIVARGRGRVVDVERVGRRRRW
mgnify:CR=1 FL=1